MTIFSTIIVETIGPVTRIRLHRPDALNALNDLLMGELVSAFHAFDADSNQRCAILCGSTKAFAAGADITEMAEKSFGEAFVGNFLAPFDGLARVRKPWLAAVAGHALGGGCELAMMADFIIAADNAQFAQPEIKLGITPGLGGTQRLIRSVGKALAMDLCLTGRSIDAEEALACGLVSRVVPHADLDDAALLAAKSIAGMPPIAALACKEMVNMAQETTLQQGLAFERRLFNGLFATRDQKEGMAAFVQKRQASWSGQ